MSKLAALMDDAEADVLAYMSFPLRHRAEFNSTNSPKRLKGEIKRRGDVVGIFPSEAAGARLIGTLLLERTDEGVVQRARYMTLETIAPLSDDPIVGMSVLAAWLCDQPQTGQPVLHHSRGYSRGNRCFGQVS